MDTISLEEHENILKELKQRYRKEAMTKIQEAETAGREAVLISSAEELRSAREELSSIRLKYREEAKQLIEQAYQNGLFKGTEEASHQYKIDLDNHIRSLQSEHEQYISELKQRFRKEANIKIEEAEERGRATAISISEKEEIRCLQEEIKNLKAKYKIEALSAIEQAKQKAFDEGRHDGLKEGAFLVRTMEEDMRKTKALSMIWTKEDASDPSVYQAPLVRFFMEQIFQDIKKEFTDVDINTELIGRIKSSLIKSNNNLLKQLSGLYLVSDKPKVNHLPSSDKLLSNNSNNDHVSHRHLYPKMIRSPIHFYIDITVNGIVSTNNLTSVEEAKLVASLLQNSKSNTFGTPRQIMTYLVETAISCPTNDNNDNILYKQIRRYNDFLSLYTQLVIDYPNCILPSITPKDYDSLNMIVAESRRKKLQLWLLYITHHRTLQSSKLLKQFITEYKSPPTFWVTKDHFLVKEGLDTTNSNINTGQYTTSNYFDSNSKFKCMKEKKSIQRQLDRLLVDSEVFITSCKHLIDCYNNTIQELTNVSSALQELSLAENDSNPEKEMINDTILCFQRTLPSIENISDTINHNILIPSQFMYQEAMASAKNQLDSAGAGFTTDIELKKQFEFVQQWKYFRHVRQEIFSEYIYRCVDLIASDKQRMLSHWEASNLNDNNNNNNNNQSSSALNDYQYNKTMKSTTKGTTSSVLQHAVSDRPKIASGSRRDPVKIFKKIDEELVIPTENDSNKSKSDETAILSSSSSNNNNSFFSSSRNSLFKWPFRNSEKDKSNSNAIVTSSNSNLLDIHNQQDSNNNNNRDDDGDDGDSLMNKVYREKLDEANKSVSKVKKLGQSAKYGSNNLFKEEGYNSSDESLMNKFYREKLEEANKVKMNNNKVNKLGPVSTSKMNSNLVAKKEEYESDSDETPMNKFLREKLDEANKLYSNKFDSSVFQDDCNIEEDGEEYDVTNERRRQRRMVNNQNITSSNGNVPPRRHKNKLVNAIVIDETDLLPKSVTQVPQRQFSGKDPNAAFAVQSLNEKSVSNLTQNIFIDGNDLLNSMKYNNNNNMEKTNHVDNINVQQNHNKSSEHHITRNKRSQSTVDEDSSVFTSTSGHVSKSTPVTMDSNNNNVLYPGWEEVFTEDGRRYYYHTITRVSRWDKPDEHITAALEARIDASQKQMEENLQKRKQEREIERRLQEELEQETLNLKQKVKQIISNWKQPPKYHSPRGIGELLSSIHSIIPDIVQDGAISSSPLNLNSPPAEIKKAYMRAVRYVHPDKLSSAIELEQRLIAEEVFICISQLFDAYKKSHS